MAKSKADQPSAGEILREQRVNVLRKGLREMARHLDIAPPHLTDLEKDRRTPSQPLLLRIAAAYQLDVAVLQAAWGRADATLTEMVTQNAETVRRLPEFLRRARDLTPEQWDRVMKQVKQVAREKPKPKGD